MSRDISKLPDTPQNRIKAAEAVIYGPIAADYGTTAPTKLIEDAKVAFIKLTPADIAAIGELILWTGTH